MSRFFPRLPRPTLGMGRRPQRFDANLGPFDQGDCRGEPLGDIGVNFDPSVPLEDADLADLLFGDLALAANHRDQPARIGILEAPDIEAEPHPLPRQTGFPAGFPSAAGLAEFPWFPGCCHGSRIEHLLGGGQMGPVHADQSRGEVLGRALRQQSFCHCQVIITEILGDERTLQQPFLVEFADILGRRGATPGRVDARRLQQHLSPAATGQQHQQNTDSFSPGTAGASAAMLQNLRILG